MHSFFSAWSFKLINQFLFVFVFKCTLITSYYRCTKEPMPPQWSIVIIHIHKKAKFQRDHSCLLKQILKQGEKNMRKVDELWIFLLCARALSPQVWSYVCLYVTLYLSVEVVYFQVLSWKVPGRCQKDSRNILFFQHHTLPTHTSNITHFQHLFWQKKTQTNKKHPQRSS